MLADLVGNLVQFLGRDASRVYVGLVLLLTVAGLIATVALLWSDALATTDTSEPMAASEHADRPASVTTERA